jgi:hypothetical protein
LNEERDRLGNLSYVGLRPRKNLRQRLKNLTDVCGVETLLDKLAVAHGMMPVAQTFLGRVFFLVFRRTVDPLGQVVLCIVLVSMHLVLSMKKSTMRHIMKRRIFTVIVTAVAVFWMLGGGIARAVTYTAIDLTPSGYYGAYARGGGGGQFVGDGWSPETSGSAHALLWNGTSSSPVDLNPTGFSQSIAFAADGSQQVGFGYTSNGPYALLWSGTAASAVNLHPSKYSMSWAFGVGGGQQAGYALSSGSGSRTRAMLWSGTAESAIDLTPSGFMDAMAFGTDGTRQIGQGSATSGPRALLWSGTPESAVDLTPGGYTNACALGISGTQQVGYGYRINDNFHALLWSGTASSYIDLNPSGFNESIAYDTNGTQQVGDGLGTATGGRDHALLWSGTSTSAVDLHQYLPAGWVDSYAASIDAQGNIAGYARDAANQVHAFVWTPVPEPATVVLLGMGVFGGLVWWRRRL